MPIDTLELPKHDGGEMIGRWWQIGYEVRNDDDDDDDDDDGDGDDDDDDDDDDAIKWWLRKWCLW